MEPQYLIVGAVAGAGMGYACGLIPKSAGQVVGREGAGNAALVACVVAGAVLGCLGALPLALILSAVIKGMGEPVDHRQSPWVRRRAAGVDRQGRRTPKARYTTLGRTIVCNRCKQATGLMPDGSVPAECPDCQLVFEEVPTVRPTRRDRVAYPPADEVIDLEVVEPDRPVADRRSVT
jgi:hypothetical protein